MESIRPNKHRVAEVKRVPIITKTQKAQKLLNPEYLEPEALIIRFTPLLKSIHRQFLKYETTFRDYSDSEDLWNQIVYEFLRLRKEYDPKRGVDFAGYIKFHIQHRVYHFVTKTKKVCDTEEVFSSFITDDEEGSGLNTIFEVEDEKAQESYEVSEALASIPLNKIKNPFHITLINMVLLEHKTLEMVAEELNMSNLAVSTQFDNCCYILNVLCNNEDYVADVILENEEDERLIEAKKLQDLQDIIENRDILDDLQLKTILRRK